MKLNEQMVAAITGDEVVEEYKAEIGELFNEKVILKQQVTKQQALIRYLFDKAPEAFPDDYILKEENNGTKNK